MSVIRSRARDGVGESRLNFCRRSSSSSCATLPPAFVCRSSRLLHFFAQPAVHRDSNTHMMVRASEIANTRIATRSSKMVFTPYVAQSAFHFFHTAVHFIRAFIVHACIYCFVERICCVSIRTDRGAMGRQIEAQ